MEGRVPASGNLTPAGGRLVAVDFGSALVALVVLAALGLVTGMLTGLSPGLHVNNVAAFLIAAQGAWIGVLAILSPEITADPEATGLLLSCFLVATASSHAVFNFIPTVFLGAATEDTALATLPGHRLLRSGQGATAVALAARGASLGTLLSVIFLVPLRVLLADPMDVAEKFRPWTPLFLGAVLAAILAAEWRGPNRARRILRGALVQALAGILGIATLRGSVPIDPAIVLFPLFSGLFGIPGLLIGLASPSGEVPPQRLEPLRGLSREDARSALRGTLAGAAISWLPGLSGGAAATLASVGARKRVAPSQFMVVLGAVSSSTGLLSVAVLYIIHRSRSGAAAAVRLLVGTPAPWTDPGFLPVSLILLVLAGVGSTAAAAPIASRLARRVARRWSRSNPRRLAAASLLGLLGLLAFTTGPIGLAVAACAAILGFVPIRQRVRRVHLMASLLVPVLVSALDGSVR
jgi:putative membrane protein